MPFSNYFGLPKHTCDLIEDYIVFKTALSKANSGKVQSFVVTTCIMLECLPLDPAPLKHNGICVLQLYKI